MEKNYDKMKKTLFSSIQENKVLHFDYVSKQAEVTRRKVYPICLFLYQEKIYLSAFCLLRSEYRTFLIESLGNCKKSAQGFEREQLLPTSDILRKTRFNPDEVELLSEVTEMKVVSDVLDQSAIVDIFENETFSAKNIFRYVKQQNEYGLLDMKRVYFAFNQITKAFSMMKKDKDVKDSIANMFQVEDGEKNFGHIFKAVSKKVWKYEDTEDEQYLDILRRERELKIEKQECEARLRQEYDIQVLRSDYGTITKAA
jgi:hypothetical protein